MKQKKINFLLISLHILLNIYSLNAEDEQKNEPSSLYLPGDISPTKYTLTIITNLEDNNFNYSGDVIIEIICNTETSKIVLHAKEIDIANNDVSVKAVTANGGETDVEIETHGYEKENDFYSILLKEKLIPLSIYRVYIAFRNDFNENLEGYYKTSYIEKETGKIKWIAVTEFSPSSARLCFPCLDEPALKAKFKIFMGHAPNLKAISNMPIKKSDSFTFDGKEDWIMDEFHETELMSTYIVAFALAEYEHTEVYIEGIDKKVGIWIRKELLDQTKLALETVSGALQFFTKYFEIGYPLPKLDLVSVPEKKYFGMENYGMITLVENYITYDPKSSNVMDKYGTVQLICHETCHQWFGNYVTMKTWNELFLKEGFASYFEDICASNLFPDWKSLDQMVFRKYLNALAVDGVLSSHPIIFPISKTTDVGQYFDTIAYEKAPIVIRMMRIFLTEKVFQAGLINYLKNHKFGVATADDMWNEMAAVAKAAEIPLEPLTVKRIMDSWTLQMGYPSIMVKINYFSGTVTITQERYLSEKIPEGTEIPHLCWDILINHATSKNPKFEGDIPKHWSTCEGPLNFEVDIKEGEWILINIGLASFMTINYENDNWLALKSTLTSEDSLNIIDVVDRAQILANCFDMSWISRLPYDITFQIVNYLLNEKEYLPLRTALESLRQIRDLLLRTAVLQQFEDIVKRILEPKFNAIGNINNIPDEFTAYRLYTLIIYWACIYRVESCHDQSIIIFKPWQEDQNPDENNPILPNLRDIVYCEALKTGGETVFNFMYTRYYNSKVPTEKFTIIEAMGCTEDENLLQRFLDWSIDPEKISKEHSTRVFYTVATKKIGFNVAKNFLFNNFASILKYHGQGNSSIGEYFQILAGMMISDEELKEFEAFLKSAGDQLEGNEVSVQKSLSSIKENILWENNHLEEFSKLLTPPRK